jgi:hypothetical protein
VTTPAAAGNDRTTLWGVLAIIGSFCCWPLGVLFGVLCLMEARKSGRPPTLAYVAFGVLVIGLIFNIIAFSTGGFHLYRN